MKKYILVIKSYTDANYSREIGKPTDNRRKLEKAQDGVDDRINIEEYYSVINEIKEGD